MSKITTPNYELSANIAGPENSSRLALDFTGFLETWRYPNHRAYVDTFAKLGCLAISFDPPEIWGSRVRQDSVYQGNSYQMQGYSMFRQIDAATELLTEKIEQDRDLKATLVGHSIGGMAAAMVAHLFPKNVDSLVLDRAPSKFVRDSNRPGRKAWEKAGTETFYKPRPKGWLKNLRKCVKFEVNSEFTEYADVYSTQQIMPILAIPKLYVVGKLDEQVLLSDIKEDYAMAAEPKDWVESESDHYSLTELDILRNAYLVAKKFTFKRPRMPYSNSEVIAKDMAAIGSWMERNDLIPQLR